MLLVKSAEGIADALSRMVGIYRVCHEMRIPQRVYIALGTIQCCRNFHLIYLLLNQNLCAACAPSINSNCNHTASASCAYSRQSWLYCNRILLNSLGYQVTFGETRVVVARSSLASSLALLLPVTYSPRSPVVQQRINPHCAWEYNPQSCNVSEGKPALVNARFKVSRQDFSLPGDKRPTAIGMRRFPLPERVQSINQNSCLIAGIVRTDCGRGAQHKGLENIPSMISV